MSKTDGTAEAAVNDSTAIRCGRYNHVWDLPDGWEDGKPCRCGKKFLAARNRDEEIARLREELATARETNARLNRRCQEAEAGIAEKITHFGPSLGRVFANAAASIYKRERDEALAELARLRATISASARAEGAPS